MEPRIFILIGIVCCAWIINSYYDFARQKGWPVGNFFLPGNGKGFKMFAFVAGAYFSVAGAIDFGWYFLFITPVAGFILAFLLTNILQKHTQMFSLVLFVLLILTNIFIQIEFISV
jgi:hypothetical protein